MTSEVDICNLALSQLGQDPITNILNPQTKVEQLCALWYPLSRDSSIQGADWSFSIFRAVLTGGATLTPEWGYTNKFNLPTNYLRLIFVSNSSDERLYNPSFRWRLEEGAILANSPQVYVRGVERITDTTRYPPSFIDALSTRLAMDLCIPITESKPLLDRLTNNYAIKMATASTLDALQGKSERIRVGRLGGAR